MTPNSISKSMLEAWQRTVIEISRLTKRDKQDPNLSGMLRKLAREEKSSILKLRDAFTNDREALTYSLLSNKENIVAYLLGFHIPNIFRLVKTFERVESKWGWSLKDAGAQNLSVWDLGCGSGALSQFFIEKYGKEFATCRAYLYDTNSLLLNASKFFFEKLSLPNLKMFPRKVGLQELNTNPKVFPDELIVVGLGYVWNEIQRNKTAQKKVRDLIQHFLDNQAKVLLTVMEPGQDFAARSAMTLHDEMIKKGFIPLYPCPHKESCPMLTRAKDWCYSEFPADDLPLDAQYVDDLLEIDRFLIASSAFVYASPALFSTIRKAPKKEPVVVGRPREKDGESFSYLLCDHDGDIRKTESTVSRGAVKLRGQNYPEGVFLS